MPCEYVGVVVTTVVVGRDVFVMHVFVCVCACASCASCMEGGEHAVL